MRDLRARYENRELVACRAKLLHNDHHAQPCGRFNEDAGISAVFEYTPLRGAGDGGWMYRRHSGYGAGEISESPVDHQRAEHGLRSLAASDDAGGQGGFGIGLG